MPDRPAHRVVAAWTERLAPLQTEAALAWWASNVEASPEHTERYRRALRAVEDACQDAEGFARVERSLEEGVGEPALERTLGVLRRELLPFQGPAEARRLAVELRARVNERYANVRGTVRGKPLGDNEIVGILRTSDDVGGREEAWRASKEVGAVVAADVRELARRRNEVARALGFPDHYEMALTLQEVAPAWLDAFLDRMDRATAAPFAAYKGELDARLSARFGVPARALRPWHYEDPFFQEAPETGRPSFDRLFEGRDLVALTRRTYDGLGLDVGPALGRSDLLPRAGKCQHAFCTHVDRQGDVRVLCNNVPNERWMGTMLHEFGHAIYDLSIDRSLPWFVRRPPHMSSTEAIAMLFGRLSKDPAWLVPVLGLPAAEADRVAEAAGTAFREGMLVFTRWVLVMARFERAFYRDPEQDLDTLWWDLVERYQGVRRPDGRRAPDWAAKIHVATAPVYYHAYLMGECTASQLLHHVRTTTGRGLVDNPAAGAFLRDAFFAPGASRSWDAHLAAATGSPLDPARFLADLGIVEAA
jgi:peptidyl-dipeptidase A